MGYMVQNVITDLLFCKNIPTFVIEIDKSMETTIIRIGNSRGIIIPSAILKKRGVREGARVQLEEGDDGAIALRFVPDEGPFSGPFTGPFAPLARFRDIEDPWGEDPSGFVRTLRDSAGAEKRELPDL